MSLPTSEKLGRPKKSSRVITVDQILQTSFHLIELGGLDGLTFRALAKELNVTPMAITHHVGNRKQLLSSLIALAFSTICDPTKSTTPRARLRDLLDRYCTSAIANAHLIHAMLADTTLIGDDHSRFTDMLRQEMEALMGLNSSLPALNLIIDYTHGFVCSVAAAPDGHGPTREEYLASLDWILMKFET